MTSSNPDWQIAFGKSKCTLCGVEVNKGDKYIPLHRDRFWCVCCMCVQKLSWKLTSDDITKVKNRQIMNELDERHKINKDEGWMNNYGY